MSVIKEVRKSDRIIKLYSYPLSYNLDFVTFQNLTLYPSLPFYFWNYAGKPFISW